MVGVQARLGWFESHSMVEKETRIDNFIFIINLLL